VSELWQLPLSWVWTKSGEVADVVGGGTPSTNNPANFNGDIPWITPADLSGYDKKYIQAGAKTITQEGYEASGAKRLPKGSVLFSSRAPIGYVAIASAAVTTNQGFKSFVLPSGIEPDYLYYWLRSAKRYAEDLASGTTFKEISGANAALIPLPLAPASEQIRIVAKLEELLSELDAGVAELNAAQKKLQQYRQSALKAAVEGALTADWREAHREQGTPTESGAQLLARTLAERRTRWEAKQLAKFKEQGKAPVKDWQKRYPEPAKPEITDLPALPIGWVWASAEQICESVRDGTHDTPKYVATGKPLITSTHLHDGTIDFEDVRMISEEDHCEISKRSKVDAGDVLFAMIGTIGNPVVVPKGLSFSIKNVALFKANHDGYVSEYLAAWLDSPVRTNWMRTREKGTTQRFAPLELLRALPVPLPSIAEQSRIVELLQTHLANTVYQDKAIAGVLKQITAQRHNILRAAFAGHLVPQDPADEPATVLLDRIRAARTMRAKPARARETKKFAEA
jgi:type I restriction enzyme S subunit